MRSLFSTSRSRQAASRAAIALLAASGGAACTLLNAFDPVKPEAAMGMPDTGTADAPVEAATEASDAGPAKGVIVIGGVVEGDGGHVAVLTAISPETGAELPNAREKLLVAGVHYDGLRDLWYIFESNGATHFPTPSDAVFLHVRRLDTHTGVWEELQSIKVPTLVANTHVAVLRERLVYVAYRTEADGQVGKDLVVIDTTDPRQPGVNDSPTPLAHDPIGLIGTRSSTTAAGGSITLLYDASLGMTPEGGICNGAAMCAEKQHVTVAGEGSPSLGPLVELGVHAGSPAFGSFFGRKGTPVDYIGLVTTPPKGTLQAYLPSTGAPSGSPIALNVNDPYLRPIAFADCLGQALLIGTNTETAVNAVPVAAAGTGDRGIMQHSGQSVHFEPYTSTVLAPFTQGEGYELTAFKLEGTASAPTLTLRQAPDWVTPAGLRPEIVATRVPLPILCP